MCVSVGGFTLEGHSWTCTAREVGAMSVQIACLLCTSFKSELMSPFSLVLCCVLLCAVCVCVCVCVCVAGVSPSAGEDTGGGW